MTSLLRRLFVAVVLSIAVAAPLAGFFRGLDSCGAAPAPVVDSWDSAFERPGIDPAIAPRLALTFPRLDANEQGMPAARGVCLKCCMPGAAPRDARPADGLYADSPAAKVSNATVERFLTKVLADQRQLLQAKQAALKRWDSRDRVHFATWFGTTSPAARQTIQKRVDTVMELSKRYRVSNFRAASPSKPGVFAYVYPRDPSRMFLDKEFFRASSLDRAGTLAHEMSHFLGTEDHAYGVTKCKDLARRSASLAVQNADNFEFYLEGRK